MSNQITPGRIGKWVAWIVLGILAFSALMGSFYINSEYERTVETRLGEINGEVTGPGLQFKAPFVDSAHTADIRISEINYPGEVTASYDGQTINIDITMELQNRHVDVTALDLQGNCAHVLVADSIRAQAQATAIFTKIVLATTETSATTNAMNYPLDSAERLLNAAGMQR